MGKRVWVMMGVLLAALLGAACPATAETAPAKAIRDGSRDFDFNIGTWRTHLVRRRDPLGTSAETMTLTGTVTIKPLWDGSGLWEEIEADGPKGHWRGLTVFLYNKASGQWSQRFAGADGRFDTPMYGRFEAGQATLVAQQDYNGRAILVRGEWSDIRPNSHRYTESFSIDGGRSWEVEIVADKTRIAPVAPPAFPAADDGSHDFDFDVSLWRTRSTRLKNPLTGSTEWSEIEGTTRVTPIWGGRANIADYRAAGPGGQVQLISLRLFDPKAKQWSLNFSWPGAGEWSPPMVGSFRNGRGEFYDQEDFNGRKILVRFTFIKLSATAAQSEQAFSDDGGKTWETNWINRYTRLPDEAK